MKDAPGIKHRLNPPTPSVAPPVAPVAPKPAPSPRAPVPKPRSALPSATSAAARASAEHRRNNSVGREAVASPRADKSLGRKGKSMLASAGLVTHGSGWMERKTADGVPYYHNVTSGELTWDKPDEMKDASELHHDSGNWVWFPDETQGYIPALVVQNRPDGRVVVQLENGTQATSQRGAQVHPLLRSALARTERDLTLLDSLDEGLILHNLRERFEKQHQIYTWIGNILISINPYETYPIYGTDNIFAYKTRGNRVLDPHVYVVADDALKPLLEYGENHSILISGESGAGKTWNTKQCLSYLTEVTKKSSKKPQDEKKVGVEEQILAANPILEAFGNAKTVRNDNSSRFGRFTEVHFKSSGTIDGARIDNFLLEKSRVVWQQNKERNYHVFYQLVQSPKAREYGLQNGSQSFTYLNGSGCFRVDGIDDAHEFEVMMQAFSELGFTTDEVNWVLELSSAILHLGNATFESDGGEGSRLTTIGKQSMQWIARLLQVDATQLEFSLVHRSIEVRGNVTNIPLKPIDAQDSRDALSKSIYGQLFDWLVERINGSLTSSNANPWAFIGLLDIFGFEIFQNNSFEQLCINFTNEKLQQIFNRDTFKLEEALYTKEGIQFEHIKYVDNQPILDMIEARPLGIMLTLDDMNRMPGSSDEGFVAKADTNHAQSCFYTSSTLTRKGNKCFTIRHYAGDVVYNADSFLIKNKDLLFSDLYDVMTASASDKTAKMFPPMDKQGRAKFSLGAQFRKQLDRLMNVLNQTQTHYIRCIKPNQFKSPKSFDSVISLEQLRYSGVFEAVRIRKQGFPFRYVYGRFVERYKCVLLKGTKWTPLYGRTAKDQTKEILDGTGQDFSQVKFGATMALYRSDQHRLLELLRALALERVCAMIQAIARGFMARRFYAKVRAVKPRVEKAVRARDVQQIDEALAQYSKLVGHFGSMVADIGVVQKAKRIKYALITWENLAQEMDKVVRMDLTNDLCFDALKSAVWKGETLLDEQGTEWNMQMYFYSKDLFENERKRRLDPRLAQSMDLLERDLMSEVYADCKALRYDDTRLGEIEKFLGMGPEALLKMQYRKAKSLGMQDRARQKEINIREMFLDRNTYLFEISKCTRLRSREDFASHTMMFWKRDDLARTMLIWQKENIVASLTQIADPMVAKQAIRIHKSILGWCGDKTNPSPNNLAYEIVNAGIHGSEDLRDEIYCQIIKQATSNPGPQSLSQVWKLLALVSQFFPPSTDFSNFVHIFIRENAAPHLKANYTQLLYATEYEIPNKMLTVDSVGQCLVNW